MKHQQPITGRKPPGGLLRLLLRIPIWLYRIGLGWLLGERFLLLTHTGRKSGLSRRAVLEVVAHDREKDIYYVARGFGETTDWFLNIQKTPHVRIRTGHRSFDALAMVLPAKYGEQILRDYARRHPGAWRALSRVMGYRTKVGAEDFHTISQSPPIVAFNRA
jgi:deazaflavin-dependent oxidoreductase (nitroreductase family)